MTDFAPVHPPLDIDLILAAGDPGPPVQMDGVTYCRVEFGPSLCLMPPMASEWRLYVVRADGMAMHTADASMAAGPLLHGTVIGIAGDARHWFTRAGRAAPCGHPGDGWVEGPLSSDVGVQDPALIVGRIPQSAMPNLSLLGAIRINADEDGDATARIGALIDWILEEDRRKEPGSAAVVQRISEIITIELGRFGRTHSILFSERRQETEYDPRIWRMIAAMSRDPQEHWTLQKMAEAAGMSRSAFAARYRQVVGMTPMRSLRRLRMHRAATALAHGATQKLAPLAMAAGYGSDAAFCRAFAKEFGHAPKQAARRR